MGLALEEHKHTNDIVVESAGVKVVYSNDLQSFVSGMSIEYSDKWYNKGFRLTGARKGGC